MSQLPEDKDLLLPQKTAPEGTTPIENEVPPPIPKFTVFCLAVLCLLSFGTGFYYWYTTYFLPAEIPDAIPVMAAVIEDEIIEPEDETYYEEYEPEAFVIPRPILDPRPQFVALWQAFGNEEIVGHLYIYGTELDEYVVQTADNYFYRHHNIQRMPQEGGTVFLDYQVDIFLDWDLNIVIHGQSGSVLQSILREYFEHEFFLNHPVITFNTQYAEYEWEIFSFYVAPIEFPFAVVDQDFETWGDMVEVFTVASLYNTRLDVTEYDQILTLTTPSMSDADLHYVLQARLLRHITS